MSVPSRAVVFGEAMIELSRIEGDQARIGVAGDTYNTAVYLSRLGVDVSYVTALGDCAFSERIHAALAEEKIGTEHIRIVEGCAPGLYAVVLDDKGERSFAYWRSASAARAFFKTGRARETLQAALGTDLFYLSGITLSLFEAAEREMIFQTMAAARAKGVVVAFDPNFRPRGWPTPAEAKEAMTKAIAASTITLPTFDDERELFGDDSPEACAARHLEIGASLCVVKAGAEGAYLAAGDWVSVPKKVQPIDTTGAGDSFNAGFLAAHLAGEPLPNAALAGHALAAKVLRTHGAIIPLPQQESPGENHSVF